MIDWHSIGYARGLASRTGAHLSNAYPHQDKYSRQDEVDFIAGFNRALNDYANSGYAPVAAYINEREQAK